jgi:hypothetical protein
MSIRIIFPRRSLAVFAIGLVFVMVGGVAFVYLPKARVEIKPGTEEKRISQEIMLSSATNDPNFIKFILPAQIINRDVEEIETTSRNIGSSFEDYAKGEVTLFNKQNDEQRLLPKTHLRHVGTGQFFLTNERVVIPPQGEVQVGITAKEKGARGDVVAGKLVIDKLPLGMQEVVYGESVSSFSGGVSVETPLTEKELRNSIEEVKAKAKERILGEITAEAHGAAVRQELISFDEEEVTASAEAGSQASEYVVRARLKARAFLVDENDLLSLTLLALRSAAEAEQEFINYDPQSFALEIVRSDFERGEAQVRGSLTGIFANKLGSTVFSGKNLAGLSASEVEEQLKQLPGVGEVDVSFSPFWVNAVPTRVGAVEIAVVSNE